MLSLMSKVAVVDDEKTIRSLIVMALEEEGYCASEYSNGEDAWRAFRKEMPDVVVLDIIMPRMNGLELCRRIREVDRRVPVIFLSSRDDEFDKVIGLETGADDYVCKPFSIIELTARVGAAVRRYSALSEKQPGVPDVEAGSLVMDAETYSVHWKKRPIALSVSEYRMLRLLASEPGNVKTREQLMSASFPDDSYVNERAADSHIKRIRKKIKDADPDSDCIEAVYGLGYRYRVDK
jgi:two-component system response regulator ChvI